CGRCASAHPAAARAHPRGDGNAPLAQPRGHAADRRPRGDRHVGRAEGSMKAYRGTILALLVLLVVGVVVWIVHPAMLFPAAKVESEPRLFEFEKHEMTRAEVTRPDGETIVLAEHDGKWIIEGTNFVAGRSMVNRIKHQIHDLSARATVVENPDAPELYGLGANA